MNIYKIENRECVKLDELKLKFGQRITEISAWQEDSSIMLLLISVDPQAVYQTQMWKLDLTSKKTGEYVYLKKLYCKTNETRLKVTLQH